MARKRKKSEEKSIILDTFFNRKEPLNTGVWIDRDLPAETRDEAINRGILIHHILEQLPDKTHLPRIINKMAEDGLLDAELKPQLTQTLQQFLSEPPASDWFQTGLKVYAEKEIIEVDGKGYRPDRVVLLPEKTILIDFKTGQHREQYATQLKKYVDLLQRMGLPSVQAWLAYTDRAQFVEV
jgi:ATP-dependent helicase/nuclease subunit A